MARTLKESSRKVTGTDGRSGGRMAKQKPSGDTGSGSLETARFEAAMRAAGHSGLLGDKSARIGGRISAALLERARKRTGLEADTDLIEFALVNLALDDDFGRTFEQVRETVDPSLKLGF